MSSAEELIREADKALSRMGDDLDAMKDFIGLICLLLTAPDIEGECPGLHRLVITIGQHLNSAMERQLQAERSIRRLANP